MTRNIGNGTGGSLGRQSETVRRRQQRRQPYSTPLCLLSYGSTPSFGHLQWGRRAQRKVRRKHRRSARGRPRASRGADPPPGGPLLPARPPPRRPDDATAAPASPHRRQRLRRDASRRGAVRRPCHRRGQRKKGPALAGAARPLGSLRRPRWGVQTPSTTAVQTGCMAPSLDAAAAVARHEAG